MPAEPANPSEEARIRRDRAAHARELARNITDQYTIDNLHALASDLDRQAAELDAQAAAPLNSVKTPEVTAQQSTASATAQVAAQVSSESVKSEGIGDETKGSARDP